MHTQARLIQLLPYPQERQILYEEALSYSNYAGKQGRFSYQNTLTRIGHKIELFIWSSVKADRSFGGSSKLKGAGAS